jgi:hypothetical protein
VPLCFAVLDGLSRPEIEQVRSASTALSAVRLGFLDVRLVERQALHQRSGHAFDDAFAGTLSALDSLERDAGALREPVAVLRSAIDRYAAVFARVTIAERTTNASVDAIEATLGQLATGDEAALLEPLLRMRNAEMEFLTQADPRKVHQVSRWAETFTSRLAEAIIPEGTRTGLAARLVTYQLAILDTMNAAMGSSRDTDTPELAVRALEVEAAVENVDRLLTVARSFQDKAFDSSRARSEWIAAGGLMGIVLLAAACGFAFGRGSVEASTLTASAKVVSVRRLIGADAASGLPGM